MTVGIILQARMGSSRLPGKVMEKLGSKTILEYILCKLSELRNKYQVVVATTISPQDDCIECWCRDNGWDCFRGSESDVLERYIVCATRFRYDHVVRLTADNPFVDVEDLINLINLHLESGADYTHSLLSLPVGVGCEIFRYDALKGCHEKGKKINHREHVNEYILENTAEFKIELLQVAEGKRYLSVRLTVDTPDDLERVRLIIKRAGSDVISTEEAIYLCMRSA